MNHKNTISKCTYQYLSMNDFHQLVYQAQRNISYSSTKEIISKRSYAIKIINEPSN